MELSLTTFILEIINFLVLIWILKRLFLTPIKNMIESRRLEIQKTLKEATETQTQAQALQTQYEARLKDWEEERVAKLADLKKEMDQEREKRRQKILSESAQEQERLKTQNEKTRQEAQKRQEQDAISQSLKFLTKMLSPFSSKEIESQIIHKFSKELMNQKLMKATTDQSLLIRSAFPLTETETTELKKALDSYLQGKSPALHYETDPNLVAGLELIMGDTVFRANLRDELKFFSKAGQDDN